MLNENKGQYENNREPGLICPFMSDSKGFVTCNPNCKFYRGGKPGYECYFQELQSISWNTRPSNRTAGYQGPPQRRQ